MRIGIHAVAAVNPERTGVGEYTYQLLRAWATNQPPEHTFLVYSHTPLDFNLPPSFTFRQLRAPFLWTQGRLPFSLWRDRPDIMFFPSQFPPLAYAGPVAVTIHGCEFKEYPEHYPFWQRIYLDRLTALSLKKARVVLAVSQATAGALERHYGFPAGRAIVIHHGVSVPSPIGSELPAGVQKPFFLFLGRVGFKKNVDGLIRAFNQAAVEHRTRHQLVIAGPWGHDTARLIALARKLPATDSIVFTGYVPEDTKWALLRGARALVFPSHAEGFGIPLIEAQAVGTPVIAADIPVFREIADSGIRWARAGDDADLAGALVEVTRNPQLRAILVEGSRRSAQRFSWEKTATETLAAITAHQPLTTNY
ncbi:glycosyltransferase family 4 protein [Candidatus Parcubacteria bacterium]|nr:glycosyltransferase family 4 protein [Candidatus Parcubacteria bacterium]